MKPTGLKPEAESLLEAANALAREHQHVALEPEHVVLAFLSSREPGIKDLVTAAHPHIQWAINHRMKEAATAAEAQSQPVMSRRYADMISKTVDMGGAINHLAAVSTSLSNRFDDRGSIFDDERSQETTEQQREEMEAEKKQRDLEHRLHLMSTTTPKKVSFSYNFDAGTGVHAIELKAEAGPGFERTEDGPHAVKDKTVKKLVEFVRTAMGHGSHDPWSASDEDDSDYVKVGGERESLGIFD